MQKSRSWPQPAAGQRPAGPSLIERLTAAAAGEAAPEQKTRPRRLTDDLTRAARYIAFGAAPQLAEGRVSRGSLALDVTWEIAAALPARQTA
jgi:hypothetical protein